MGALQQIEAGNVPAAVNDIETSLGKLFTGDVVPALKLFVTQFLTPFGSQALALAGTAVGEAVSGTPIQTIAASVEPQITADAVTDAEKAGDVVLNAVRVQLTAQSTAPVADPNAISPVPTPETPASVAPNTPED